MSIQHLDTHSTLLSFVAGCFVGLCGAASSAPAALVAYDGMNYRAGSVLAGLSGSGSFGFAQPWQLGGIGSPQHQIGPLSLSHPVDALETNGNRGVVLNESPAGFTTARRSLAQQLGTAGSRRYVSLLLRPEGPLGAGDAGGYFGLELVASGTSLFIGKPSMNEYVLEDIGGTEQYSTGVNAMADEPVLLVLRADFASGNDVFRLYVNPTPGQSEPLTPDAVKVDTDVGVVTAVGLFSSGAFSFDEIRIGEKFADVTPIPEPSSLWLLGGLLGGLFQASRRL